VPIFQVAKKQTQRESPPKLQPMLIPEAMSVFSMNQNKAGQNTASTRRASFHLGHGDIHLKLLRMRFDKFKIQLGWIDDTFGN
jgi:hypothetical protein